jgi:putative transposase
MMDEIGRKHPVHLEVHDRRDTPIIVYLTVCTTRRKPILANPAAHELLLASWREARLWLLGRYVIMPNHLHLFCTPAINYGGTSFVSSQTSLSEVANLGRHSGRLSNALEKWVEFWKSHSARHWLNPEHAPIWQRHFWDTQLRRDESYNQKWHYVVENPVRAGLVKHACDWPYHGEMNELRWYSQILRRHGGRPSMNPLFETALSSSENPS